MYVVIVYWQLTVVSFLRNALVLDCVFDLLLCTMAALALALSLVYIS